VNGWQGTTDLLALRRNTSLSLLALVARVDQQNAPDRLRARVTATTMRERLRCAFGFVVRFSKIITSRASRSASNRFLKKIESIFASSAKFTLIRMAKYFIF